MFLWRDFASLLAVAVSLLSTTPGSPSGKVFYLFRGCCWPTCNKMKVKYINNFKIVFLFIKQ